MHQRHLHNPLFFSIFLSYLTRSALHCNPCENRIDTLRKHFRKKLLLGHTSIFRKLFEIFRRILIGLYFFRKLWVFHTQVRYLPISIHCATLRNQLKHRYCRRRTRQKGCIFFKNICAHVKFLRSLFGM